MQASSAETLMPGSLSALRHNLATVRKWKEFKHRTGKWPLFSIIAAISEYAILAVIVGFLIWYSGEKHWSKNRFGLVILSPVLAVVLISGWLRDRIWIAEAQRRRLPSKYRWLP
jgi:hypothetical protein